ncbi:MAG: aldo/keto reductase [Microlunatus sp.]|nr:aldo/keto reductase [Microlunatus sp.]
MPQLRRLGSTDVEITPIGLGTMQFANRGPITATFAPLPADISNAVVQAALDGGITWFDTAEMYGRGLAERALTSGLKAAGAEPGSVLIATKWIPFGRTASSIGRTIGDRLEALQGYPIDLHQIHMPYGSLSPLRAEIDAMADLAEAGKIRHIGVSNFSAAQMERAHLQLARRGLVLASNQVQISLVHRSIETNGVLAAARRLGITLIGYSPLAQGLLTGRFHDDPEAIRRVPRGRRFGIGGIRPGFLSRTAPLITALRRIADDHGAKPAQIALAWLINNYGDNVVGIPGASKPTQAAEIAEAMTIELSKAELAALNEA